MSEWTRLSTRALLGALFALGACLAGCGDIGLAVVGYDAGPDITPFRCHWNADCAGNPAGAVCDIPSGRCVQCTVAMDNCPAAQHCDPVTLMCVNGCRDDTGCPMASAPHCLVAEHRCVPCVVNSDCPMDMSCVANMCVRGCPAPNALCQGVCTDVSTSVTQCGMCGRACMSGPHGTAVCTAGTCGLTCEMGYGDCNMTGGDGCEVDLRVTPANCGMCGNTCPMGPHSTATCAASTCGLTCDMGYANCNMMSADGCEVNTQTDGMNCGMCGRLCPSGPHSTPSCAAGVCGITCDPGYANCNMIAADGCEVDTRSDLANCGACANRCMLAHATSVCTAGACAVMTCEVNFANCNMRDSDGCEADLQNDNATCGSCAHACGPTEQCYTGLCDRFPSNGTEGPFNPMRDTTLSPGVHNYTTITVPTGVTVRSDGNGPLNMRATGAIVVAGIIDVSGGDGGRVSACNGIGSGGGTTGAPVLGSSNSSCPGGLGVCGGPGGAGGTGALGLTGASTVGGSGGARGGGGGGGYVSGVAAGSGGGGGGGGFAGGGGGAGAGRGCAAALGNGGAGGAGGGPGGAAGGSLAGSPGNGATAAVGLGYEGVAGRDASLCSMGGNFGGGGGGGSIGPDASNDLAIDRDTFQPGSAGGGGGGPSGGGGGGGGGTVRLASPVSITITNTGQILARGGSGALGSCGGGGGGGGSGGLIYLYAPALSAAMGSTVGADFGGGGFAVSGGGLGGPGGMGRIRISVLGTRCTLAPVFTPTLHDETCAFTPGLGVPRKTYVRAYPD